MKMKFSSEILPRYAERWTLTDATVTVYLTSDHMDYEVYRTEVLAGENDGPDDLDNLHQRGVAEFAIRLREVLGGSDA